MEEFRNVETVYTRDIFWNKYICYFLEILMAMINW